MSDLQLLESKIQESGLKKTAIADKMGISRPTLTYKLKGHGIFTSEDIVSITKILKLTNKERDKIFLQ